MHNGKVIWLEGMPLSAQHFQQHDRFLDNLINGRCQGIQPFNWGFRKLTIDTDLLKTGKLAIKECSGIFQDGTPFDLPGNDDLPLPLDVPEDMGNELIYLSLPVRRSESVETDSEDHVESLARYRMRETYVKNNITDGLKEVREVPLYIGKLKIRLLLEKVDRSGYTCLGVARVLEARADKNIIINDEFIPPNMNCNIMKKLSGYIIELMGVLNTRGEAIANRMGTEGGGGVAETSDLLLLQVVNRYQLLFKHLSTIDDLHPEELYRLLIQLSGELATFLSNTKRPADFPEYRHDNLQTTFQPVMDEIRQLLTREYEQRAIPIKLNGPEYNTYGADTPDIGLLKNAIFVLAVKAQVDSRSLTNDLPKQIVIAPIEKIREFINSLIPGISIQNLQVPPRELPFHPGFSYFELDTKCDLWKEMTSSAGMGIHISADFPDLQLELWAIKQQ
ncbi:type VI secretion system baseplate subunit TssK [Desulfobacterales bacterium HSG16]|nr:type VI secretion system baseplate subunit TssK [Desulfobacterales bacterium HSG16]